MHILGALDRPTEGRLQIRDVDVLRLDDDERAQFRNRHVGFVFQFHNLLPEFTALENVMMPALIARHADGLETRAWELLEKVGLEHRLEHRPGELSGGECQRVAVARALVMKPELVLADEPTANLDSATGYELIQTMKQLNEDQGVTFVFATHDGHVMERSRRVVQMVDGSIDADEIRT